MNLLKLIKNKKKHEFKSGDLILIELNNDKNKSIFFEGLIVSIKKKYNLTIIRKINNIYFKLLIDINSTKIKSLKLIKNFKKKKSKIYNNFNRFY